ncbi:MAG: AbrB/MazE/SpoVT family DNA-binding domain-containing protein [Acidobacteriota bacterium]
MTPEGRVLIPAKLRRQLKLEPGCELVSRVEDGRLMIESRENVLRRLQDRFAHLPPEVSLAEELIAQRRRENE